MKYQVKMKGFTEAFKWLNAVIFKLWKQIAT